MSHKQRVALSDILYRAFAENLADDPGDPSLWARVQAANCEAISGPIFGIHKNQDTGRLDALERRFGRLTDAILQREGIVTDTDSRNGLLKEAARALTEATDKLHKNASGDYRPDPNGAPSHALRHWFKTACQRVGVLDSVADAIQGHRGSRGEADGYRQSSIAEMHASLRCSWRSWPTLAQHGRRA